ncbi:MAG TPA: thioesterase family protein, partial [Polyangiaceae bacterium]
TMPTLPPVDACERFRDKYPSAVELQRRYDNRWGLGDPLGSNSKRALIGGWIRFDEPHATDALAVAAYTDAFVPAVFTRVPAQSAVGPVPTIDLTIHFRASLPLEGSVVGEHCIAVFTSRTSREGFMEEDGEIWSAGGVLLAESRQLALVG